MGFPYNCTVPLKPPALSIRWPDFGGKGEEPSCATQSKQARKLGTADESLCILKEWGHAFFPMNSYLPFYYELHHPFYLGLFCLGVRDICSCDHPPPIETDILSINTRHCTLGSRYPCAAQLLPLTSRELLFFSLLLSPDSIFMPTWHCGLSYVRSASCAELTKL